MAGALLAVAALGGKITTTYTVTVGTKSAAGVPAYDDGFYNAASHQYSATNSVAIGSITGTTFKGANVNGIYWTSGVSQADTNGQCCVEIAGNVGAAFVSGLSVAGVSMGSVSSTSYDATANSTVFYFTPLRANPFGTSGTKSVAITG